ncbi:quinolinate synthase NadA [Candidatus Methanoperedens nitratireducens]|uniref:Quinolinate synthase n=1 Tax=Candidatus Methanoperedens nitratireducens TaxID=1392998 RepID=A0A284VK38_9EURY|nr:quinolinate synthase NadA [Candidatus Methanoperedens nitroreducens]SNQ59620.1 Quinolinate synthase A [Candidatus Methanoperedens nitroreducens]
MNDFDRIKWLKKEKNAIILAHNYQRGDVQDAADFVGDSFGLSQKAVSSGADVIVFCGVDFMAESAAVLNPGKTVLMPELSAQCPMAGMITPESLKLEKEKHPGAAVICYVNTSAAVKAQSDVCCTSANAIKVVNSMEADEIIFVPDRNLALYVAANTEKKIIPWKGYCPTHHLILPGDILLEKEEHPDALVLVHPECRPEVVALADKVLSTSGMLKYAAQSSSKEFIIGTEVGLLHRLNRENPDKKFIPATRYAVCPNMKMNTLGSIIRALERNEHVIKVPEDIRKRAKLALDRMLEVGRGD